MILTPDYIRNKYRKKRADSYDFSLPPFFKTWKEKAIVESSLNKGDDVIVFCCGTGLDFTHILKKIGPEGRVTGVDFSKEMLSIARTRIRKNRWQNIELIEEDVTRFNPSPNRKWDAGICTLGLSIIPDFKGAYHNLMDQVKENGTIIIGDMKLADGLMAIFNPLTLFLSKNYGGTRVGHTNSLKMIGKMKKDLKDIRYREFFFNSYYYCVGKKAV